MTSFISITTKKDNRSKDVSNADSSMMFRNYGKKL